MTSDRYSRDLRRYLAGACAARLATEGVAIALAVVARATGTSTAVAGVLLAAWSGPSLVSGLLVGHRLDRSARPRRFLVLAGGCAAVALGVDAALLGRVPAAGLVVLTALGGAAVPLFTGGLSSMLSALVPADSLARTQALDAATYSVSGIAGPGLVALLAAAWTPRVALTAAAVAVVAGVLIVPVARRRRPESESADEGCGSIRRRLAALANTPQLRATTAATTLAAFGWGGLEIGAVAVAALAGSPRLAGILLTVLGATALAGALTVSRVPLRRPDRVIPACLLAMAAGSALVALTDSPLTLSLGFAVFGIGDGVLLPATLAVRSRDAPVALSASVFTTAASLKTAAGALGAAAAGLAGTWLGGRGLFCAVAVTQLLAALVAMPAAVAVASRPQARESPREPAG